MLKLIYVLVLVTLAPLVVQGQLTDRYAANLRGEVKSVRARSIEYSGDRAEGPGFNEKQMDAVTFDAAGNEIERVTYNDFGELMGKTVRTYEGRRRIESRMSDPRGALMRRDMYVYKVEPGKFDTNTVTQIISYNAVGVVRQKTDLVYDERGWRKSESYSDATRFFGETRYTRDDRGNIIDQAYFTTDGTKAIAPVGPCFEAHRVAFRYNEDRRAIAKILYDTSGGVLKTWRYAYNEKGDLAEHVMDSSSASSRTVYKYEYDPKGNWVKAVISTEQLATSSPMKRTTVVTREIVYF